MQMAAVDNDVLHKAAWYGLLEALVAAIPAERDRTLVLGEARYVVGKKLERSAKKGVPGAAEALERFSAALNDFAHAEPTAAELSFAADLENAAQLSGLPLDAGESILCALTVHRSLDALATGDKRAIRALETLIEKHPAIKTLAGKLVCLEQLLMRAIEREDATAIRAGVCAAQHVDKAVTACFACSSAAIAAGDCVAALASYVADLRSGAPTLLAALPTSGS
jgi:hypothetical protein